MRISPAATKFGQAGLTLLELLVVLAIAGLMLGLAGGWLGDGLQTGMRKQQTEITDLARVTHIEAMMQGQALPLPHIRPAADIDVEVKAPTSDGRILFYPDGSSSGGHILLQQGGVERTLQISARDGSISVQ